MRANGFRGALLVGAGLVLLAVAVVDFATSIVFVASFVALAVFAVGLCWHCNLRADCFFRVAGFGSATALVLLSNFVLGFNCTCEIPGVSDADCCRRSLVRDRVL